MSKADILYEKCELILKELGEEAENIALFLMADEVSIPFVNENFDFCKPTRIYHLLALSNKDIQENIPLLDQRLKNYLEHFFNVVFFNHFDMPHFMGQKAELIFPKEELTEVQKFMFQNGKFYDEEYLIFREVLQVFVKAFRTNLNYFEKYLENSSLPVFKNMLLYSACNHGYYEEAKSNIDILNKIWELEEIDFNNEPNLDLLKTIFTSYLLDIFKSADGGYIDFDYMTQLKHYLEQTNFLSTGELDKITQEYLKINKDLIMLEGILINKLHGYTPSPYFYIKTYKNEDITPEEQGILELYNEFPQFKIAGNFLKYCVEDQLELSREGTRDIISFLTNILCSEERADIKNNLLLLLGENAPHNEEQHVEQAECVIL